MSSVSPGPCDKRAVYLMLRRRGPLSITYDVGKWHVLPSGMLQAPYRDYETEFSLLHCLFWEYYEEFFDTPDPRKRNTDPKWFYGKAPVIELQEMLEQGKASL